MRKYLLLFLSAIFILTGCSSVVEREKFIVGIDDEFAPLAFRDEAGNIVGFDIDLAKETANRMGVEFEFKPIDWDKKREELISGSIDLIWNGLDITEDRKEYMIFSEPYMDDRQILLIRADNYQEFFTEYDLANQIVGTQAGSTSYCYIKQNEKLKNSLKEFKGYSKFNEALDALSNNEIDALICDELIARYEMNSHPDRFKMVDVRIGTILETGIGFRKDDVELRNRVQAAFDELIKDGTAKKISIQWFQADLIKLKK